MPRLTGPQMERLRDAILDAFDRDALEELLLFRLDKRLDQIVSSQANLRDASRAVITTAEREGWLADLLTAMAAERPDLVNLQELVAALQAQPESRLPGPPKYPKRAKPTVFISYSHKDSAWKERLVTHLSVLADEGLFTVWDDTRIGAGQEWEREIEEAMSSAAVTVLMVSPDFLASKFVKTREVPRLLQRREQEGLRVIPVIVRPCPWSRIPWLSAMQARPRDARPLSGGTEYQIDADLSAVAEEIADILQAFETADFATDVQDLPVRSDTKPEKAIPKEPARVVERLEAPPARPDTLTITQPIRMELVRVPAGKFLMGDEKQVVDVAEFYIGKYPVTNSQYAAFAKATGRKAAITGKDDHPVVNVTWNDAVAFTEWLSAQTGKEFRLPTETQWERAARGADGRSYPWGDNLDPKKANTREGGPGQTTPVGQYSLGGDSPYGCADMAGNVSEWTSSLYRPYPYNPDDGREDPESRDARVVRGGSWFDDQWDARCAARLRAG